MTKDMQKALIKMVKALEDDEGKMAWKSIAALIETGDYIGGDNKRLTTRGLVVALDALGVKFNSE